MNRFEFGGTYRLDVTDNGFCLYDIKTDELLVDASTLNSEACYWVVELLISRTNREFYIDTGNPRITDKISMGISK